MHTNEITELMNLCMIYDDKGNVLISSKIKPTAVIAEMKE